MVTIFEEENTKWWDEYFANNPDTPRPVQYVPPEQRPQNGGQSSSSSDPSARPDTQPAATAQLLPCSEMGIADTKSQTKEEIVEVEDQENVPANCPDSDSDRHGNTMRIRFRR